MHNPSHRKAFKEEIDALFSRHSEETRAILARYPAAKNKRGCMETERLSQTDQEKFLESRRFLLEALRVELPRIVEQYPNFLTDAEKAFKDPAHRHDPRHQYNYKSALIEFEPNHKYLAYALVLHPHQTTPIHTHGVSGISYVIEGEAMENAHDVHNLTHTIMPKRSHSSGIVSPGETISTVDRHTVFSSGLYDRTVLLNISDGLRLTKEGTVEDMTGRPKEFGMALAQEKVFPKRAPPPTLR